jgi:hypothetical protein
MIMTMLWVIYPLYFINDQVTKDEKESVWLKKLKQDVQDRREVL